MMIFALQKENHDDFFFFEEAVILIRTYRHKSNISSFLNKLIIHYIIRVPLQNDLTFWANRKF